MTFPRRGREQQEESQQSEKPSKINGLVLDLIYDPPGVTAIEVERKRELVLQKQQQRQEASERRRQMREFENLKRDDERRRKDQEESIKKIEREQRRDEIYRQYLMKKDKQSSNNNDHTNGEHPIIRMRPKSSTATTMQRPPIERRQTGKLFYMNMSYLSFHRELRKPDIFPTNIASCSSGQKAQSYSAQSLEPPVHTD